MKKMIATILLDENDCYVYDHDVLPKRTTWDKELLKAFITDENLSHKGYAMLPPSLQHKVGITSVKPYPITVPEIDELADILIITRGKSGGLSGKRFRLNKFIAILKTEGLEIWHRK